MSGTPPARPKTRRAVVLLFVLLLLAATLVLLELASAFFAPSWPQRALRTRPFLQPGETGGEPVLAYWPQFGVPVNSWGMRDLPRHREKAPGGYRVLFVGDSFLEGGFTVAPLPLRVEQMLFVSGSGREEVVNLGVSGTGPPSYLYRIERVGFALQPDAVFVLFFAGNDFVSPDEAHDGWRVPPLIAEPPLPSVLGTVAPRLTWLLVARLGLAEAARGQPQVPEELTTLARIMQLPPDQAADRLAEHAQRHYFPAMDMDALRAIFARGDETFWRSFVPRELDPELLQGWIVKGLVEWETSTWADRPNKRAFRPIIKRVLCVARPSG